MKNSWIVSLSVVFLVAAGCSAPTKKDLDDSEARFDAKLAKTASELDRKVTAIDSKYANMLAMEQEVKNGVQRIDQNAKLLEGANAVMTTLLQARRNSLKEELKRIEDQLELLQKPAAAAK